ncbi:hypothetical protein BBP40_000370 [Aspergillus hancockii]|nr:hypothetical protein BBP40_000370 [Aspergillus hancockii]
MAPVPTRAALLGLANAVGISNLKLTNEESEKTKISPAIPHLAMGLNIFTPLRGLLNVLKQSTGLYNTIDLPDPEDPSKTYRTSYPVTALDDPLQAIPADTEAVIRDELREMFPTAAVRPFAQTKICWYISC